MAGDEQSFKLLMAAEDEKAVEKVNAAAAALQQFYEKRVGLRVADAIESGNAAISIMYGIGALAFVLSLLTAIGITCTALPNRCARLSRWLTGLQMAI